MKLGIKCGLKSDWKTDIETSRPEFVEIWFHSGKIDKYSELFAFLARNKLPSGLHYWGALPDGTMTNLGYPDNNILSYSRQAIKNTLDTAAKNGCVYVNLHPNGDRLVNVDFDREMFSSMSQPVPLKQALTIFAESLQILSEYAKSKGILLTLESCPAKALGHPWHGTEGREHPIEIGEFSVPQIEHLFRLPNVFFANDFGHTASGTVSDDRQDLVESLFDIARRLKVKTKLLHVSYIIPPYNGTDYHGCLYYDEINLPAAVPNRNELVELLQLYKDQDVYALVEPEKDHPRNFLELKQLVGMSLH